MGVLDIASMEILKKIMVGLPGFEPESVRPKRTSIDQTNPQARGKPSTN